jgi:biotin synthase
MQTNLYKTLERASSTASPLEESAALDLLDCEAGDLPEILALSSRLTTARFGRGVKLCAIINAKSGACSEDCAFCAQSVHASTDTEVYPFLQAGTLRDAHSKAGDNNASYFAMVTSGKKLTGKDVDKACAVVREASPGPDWCASMGCLEKDKLVALKQAGFKRFHHNIEAGASFFPEICTTHTYEERIATLRNAREAGLELCCGGIFGLGESLAQRVELAMAVARERVDAIPINFLTPIPGTPLSGLQPPKPLEILLSIAMLRFTNPKAEIRIAAGRTLLGRLQSMVFMAGCTGMMIGDLLTTSGQKMADDRAMLNGLEIPVEA